MAARNFERDQSRRDATEDLSEDLSEGEKVDANQEGSIRLSRMNSDAQLSYISPPDENKEKRLYMVLIRYAGLHGTLASAFASSASHKFISEPWMCVDSPPADRYMFIHSSR